MLRTVASALFFLCLAVSVASADPLVLAPIGGAPIHTPPGRIACPFTGDSQGWSVAPDGQTFKPPAAELAIGQPVRLLLADAPNNCATPKETWTLSAIGPRPQVDWSATVWDVDGGQLTVRGQKLKGTQLQWSLGEKSGQDHCLAPTQQGREEQCLFAIDRSLPALPEDLQLRILPAGVRELSTVTVYNEQGQLSTLSASPGSPAEAMLTHLLPPDATADVGAGSGRVPVVHPEAVESVACQDAACDLEGSQIIVNDEHGSDDVLELTLNLRPHVMLRNAQSPRSPSLSVPLQRCPFALASQTVFRGLSEQRVAVRLGGSCASDPSLEFWGPFGRAPVISETRSGGARLALVEVGRVDGDELVVTVRHAGAIVGRASRATQPAPQANVRIELPGLGPISFIPTNVAAQALLPSPLPGLMWVLKPLPGFYDVGTDSKGVTVKGAEGASGAVSLHLGLRDPSLPPPLQSVDLTELTDPVIRPVRVAHVPVTLTESVNGGPLAELACSDEHGEVSSMRQGTTSYLPFSEHDGCRVILHAERLPPENGSQTLRFVVDITGADGANKSDAHVDRRIVLRPRGQTDTIYIKGIDTPFDRARVQLSIEPGEGVEEGLAQPGSTSEAQWTVVFGKARLRLYATMSFPTGLYRVSDEAHSGILTLNAGALLRAVQLSRDGQESPWGAEAGVIWLAIAGDTSGAAAAHGQVALVAGVGVGIPIANASRQTQTSINLHAWIEYEASRAMLSEGGSAWGFIFGPSFTIGDVGRNF